MIQAVIFDLDGTLIQTEKLKALSYAHAAVELCPHCLSEAEVIEAFKQVVGLPQREVAEWLVQRFELEELACQRKTEFGVNTPWQVFIQLRLKYYEALIADPNILRAHRLDHNLALLETVRQTGFKLGLATMTHCAQLVRVLKILELEHIFDFTATRDDVNRGKPDPEIYLLVASVLGVLPENCLVIEDSPTGVKAALAADMHCIASTTSLTQEGVHKARLLPDQWIVDDPIKLPSTVERLLNEQGR